MTEHNTLEFLASDELDNCKYLTFLIRNNHYALDIGLIVDIIGMQEITLVPDQLNYVKGVINLRGKIIPTMDVRARFEIDEIEYDDRTCIVVVEHNETPIGLIVDRVFEVLEIHEQDISPPPIFIDEKENEYISGIGNVDNNVTMILDCNILLPDVDSYSLDKNNDEIEQAERML